MDLWDLLVAAFALWFGFQWGQRNARDKDKKAERLLKQAAQENDPATKTNLLIEWYKLTEDRGLKKTFKKHLVWRRKKARGR